ncbi:hypothetical protein B0H16DRAFT_283324 [Mycena metata]|uniref:Uncharacterized protein n=1 Tax=Mycena metata TaxID=1033252 RepID=A0AAD7HPK8_9AGAR|nr:hypothetical protein B0H16DRAFT_283324 [Mycena metata]
MAYPVLLDPASSMAELEELEERLRAVIIETAKHGKIIKKVNNEVFHPFHTARRSPSPERSSSLHKIASSSTHPPAVVRRAKNTIATPPAKLTPTQKKNQKTRVKAKERKAAGQPSNKQILDPPRAPNQWNKCSRCSHKPQSEWCTRVVYVKEKLDAAKYRGYALTSAAPGDRLKPKPTKAKTQKKSRIYKRTQYISPAELQLKRFEARPLDHTCWRNCGQDILKFIHRRESEEHLVGGFRFNALSPEALKIMQENHGRVRIHTLRRREDMHKWSYGTMTAAGSRMPVGGGKGDGYAPYASHTGETVEDIETLFRHAVDADILITVAKSIYPNIEKDMIQITEDSELNRFGRFGVTGYYCTNFISCIHSDKDIKPKVGHHPILHPCIQLFKDKCGPHDYNFGMIKWGVIVRTMVNTAWIFDGNDEHGTEMPSESAMNAGASSSGEHHAVSAKNANRASACREVRDGYDVRIGATC